MDHHQRPLLSVENTFGMDVLLTKGSKKSLNFSGVKLLTAARISKTKIRNRFHPCRVLDSMLFGLILLALLLGKKNICLSMMDLFRNMIID